MESTQAQPDLATLEARLRRLEDEAAICRLIFSWGPAADTANGEAAAALWTEDAVLQTEASETRGSANVLTMINSDAQHSLVDQGCAHVHGFPIVLVDGDQATAVNYSRVYMHSDDGYGIWRVSANNWAFVRTEDGWRATRRTVHVIDGGKEAQQLLRLAAEIR
jgi:ketosteroid isomerase-like protein